LGQKYLSLYTSGVIKWERKWIAEIDISRGWKIHLGDDASWVAREWKDEDWKSI
jgi:hypothetical protein